MPEPPKPPESIEGHAPCAPNSTAAECPAEKPAWETGTALRTEAQPPTAWQRLRQFTSARIAMGRVGGSQPTGALLDFRLSHARARDAVRSHFDAATIAAELEARGIESLVLASAASSREQYLLRPDLGRSLAAESVDILTKRAAQWGQRDLLIIVSDGLSALAAHRHAVETTAALHSQLRETGWSIYPVLIIPFARVKIQDVAGVLLGARFTLILLGERPGLGAPDSLGAYFTYGPDLARTDADRNCISNIRPEGLPPQHAAQKIASLLNKARQIGKTGVELKDDEESPSLQSTVAFKSIDASTV